MNNQGDEKKEPRLIRWANDGYPPIDMVNEVDAVLELIKAYKALSSPSDKVQEKEIVLLPQESDLLESWRSARRSIRKGGFSAGKKMLDYCHQLIGTDDDYAADKTEIPE